MSEKICDKGVKPCHLICVEEWKIFTDLGLVHNVMLSSRLIRNSKQHIAR